SVAALLVEVVGVEGEGEVMDLLGPETDTFAPRGHLPTLTRRAWCVVPIALIIDLERGVSLRFLPARIPFYRHAGRADHLVLWQVEHHVIGRELAVELASRIERVVFPAVPVVHHHLGIPLREVEAPALASLAPWEGGWARLPVDLDRERIAGGEGPRQGPVRDGRVGGIRIIGSQRLARHGRVGDPLEGIVRVLHVLKSLAPLGRVGGGPAGAGAERVQVLVHVEVAQRVGRAVHVTDTHVAGEHAGRLVQRRGDLIRDVLLPVGGGVARDENEKQGKHVRWGSYSGPGGRGRQAGVGLRKGRRSPTLKSELVYVFLAG